MSESEGKEGSLPNFAITNEKVASHDFHLNDRDQKEKSAHNLKQYLDFQSSKKQTTVTLSNVEQLLHLSEKAKKNFKPNPFAPLHLGKGINLRRALSDYTKEADIYISAKDRGQHLGCIGTTGAGKTRLMMHLITQDILNGNSLFIIDPKYDIDLFSRVIEVATISGRLDEVIYFNPILPEYSVKLNLLYQYYLPDELINHVVAGVRSKEEYFENVAYEVTTAIVLSLFAMAKARGERPNITFYEIKRWISYEKLGELQKNLEYLVHSRDPEIRRIAQDLIMVIGQIRSSPSDFFAKVSSSLRTVLTSLTTSVAGDLIGKVTQNEFLRRLESGERVIIYCNTGVLLVRKTAHVIGRIIMSMIQSLIGRMQASGRALNPPLVMYLDEGQNVLYRGIEELFAKGRSANVWINFFTQSFSSIESVVGKELANVIVDNISTWLYMRVNCEETAERVSKSLPVVTRYNTKVVPGSEGATVILGENEESVYSPNVIMGLPNRHFILKKASGEYYVGETAFVEPPRIRVLPPQNISLIPTWGLDNHSVTSH